jgi:hypothetical protein
MSEMYNVNKGLTRYKTTSVSLNLIIFFCFIDSPDCHCYNPNRSVGLCFRGIKFNEFYGFFSRGTLPEYQWMNVPEVFLYTDIDKPLCNCF